MTSASYYRLLANHRPVDGDDAKDTAHSAGGQGRQRRRLVRDANDASPGRRAGDAAAAAARAFVATESSMPGGCNCQRATRWISGNVIRSPLVLRPCIWSRTFILDGDQG